MARQYKIEIDDGYQVAGWLHDDGRWEIDVEPNMLDITRRQVNIDMILKIVQYMKSCGINKIEAKKV